MKTLTQEEENQIEYIKKRIIELQTRQSLMARAGGRAGGMAAMQCATEIEDLKTQIKDIENGTHTYEIRLLDREINRLKMKKRKSHLLERWNYFQKLKLAQEEKQRLENMDKENSAKIK